MTVTFPPFNYAHSGGDGLETNLSLPGIISKGKQMLDTTVMAWWQVWWDGDEDQMSNSGSGTSMIRQTPEDKQIIRGLATLMIVRPQQSDRRWLYQRGEISRRYGLSGACHVA